MRIDRMSHPTNGGYLLPVRSESLRSTGVNRTRCTLILILAFIISISVLPIGSTSSSSSHSGDDAIGSSHEPHRHEHSHADSDRESQFNSLQLKSDAYTKTTQFTNGASEHNSASNNAGQQYYSQYYNPNRGSMSEGAGAAGSGYQQGGGGFDYSQYYKNQYALGGQSSSPSPSVRSDVDASHHHRHRHHPHHRDASSSGESGTDVTIRTGAEGSSSNIRASGEMARGFMPGGNVNQAPAPMTEGGSGGRMIRHDTRVDVRVTRDGRQAERDEPLRHDEDDKRADSRHHGHAQHAHKDHDSKSTHHRSYDDHRLRTVAVQLAADQTTVEGTILSEHSSRHSSHDHSDTASALSRAIPSSSSTLSSQSSVNSRPDWVQIGKAYATAWNANPSQPAVAAVLAEDERHHRRHHRDVKDVYDKGANKGDLNVLDRMTRSEANALRAEQKVHRRNVEMQEKIRAHEKESTNKVTDADHIFADVNTLIEQPTLMDGGDHHSSTYCLRLFLVLILAVGLLWVIMHSKCRSSRNSYESLPV